MGRQAKAWRDRLVVDRRGCLVWTGRLDDGGYGRVWDVKSQRLKLAHRLAWEEAHGAGLRREEVLHHECRNKACVLVAHLTLTTRWAHRAEHHRGDRPPCPHGESPACRECCRVANLENQRQWKAKRKAAGGCRVCSAKAVRGMRVCQKHREREAELKRAARLRDKIDRLGREAERFAEAATASPSG